MTKEQRKKVKKNCRDPISCDLKLKELSLGDTVICMTMTVYRSECLANQRCLLRTERYRPATFSSFKGSILMILFYTTHQIKTSKSQHCKNTYLCNVVIALGMNCIEIVCKDGFYFVPRGLEIAKIIIYNSFGLPSLYQ